MGGLMSRNKGKRAEREVIGLLQPIMDAVYARRGVPEDVRVRLKRNTMQSDGGGFDVYGLEWMAPEVKHQETLHCEKWWQQCEAQAMRGQTPVLFYRRNNTKWRVRLWSQAVVGGGKVHCFVADMSIGDFLKYFAARFEWELGMRELDEVCEKADALE